MPACYLNEGGTRVLSVASYICQRRLSRGERYLTGETRLVVWAEFSTL
jgi:hypothetical protein